MSETWLEKRGMNIMDRVGEQANTKRNVEGHGLKFKHSNWN